MKSWRLLACQPWCVKCTGWCKCCKFVHDLGWCLSITLVNVNVNNLLLMMILLWLALQLVDNLTNTVYINCIICILNGQHTAAHALSDLHCGFLRVTISDREGWPISQWAEKCLTKSYPACAHLMANFTQNSAHPPSLSSQPPGHSICKCKCK